MNKDDIFSYTPDIDKKLPQAVSSVINEEVRSSAKIEKGEYNHVYKIETSGKPLIARIFRHRYWPEEDKLPWIEKQLTMHKVPHAKTIYYSRDEEYFPNGFMLSEFIEGENARDAVKNKIISSSYFYESLGRLLKAIHTIEVQKFGEVNEGEGQFVSFLDEELDNLENAVRKNKDVSDIGENVLTQGKDKVEEILRKYKDRLKPVLIHGDATGKNCILTPENKLVLIDWDNARSAPWISEIAWITFWCTDLHEEGEWEDLRKKVHASIFKTYPLREFSYEEFSEIERAMHIRQAMLLMPYYLLDQKNVKSFEETKERLVIMLKS